MAIYVSTARRKRNTLLVAAVTALAGLVLGWVIGHNQAPSISGRVQSVQRDAEQLAARVESQQIHYDKVLGGDGDLKLDVLDSVDELRKDLLRTLDRAPWVDQRGRDDLTDAVSALSTQASAKVTPAQYATTISEVAALVRATLRGGDSAP
jgi:hypothetical protein